MAERATIYEIAKIAGVSVATVNRAFQPNAKINFIKKELILELSDKYGYQPNKAAARLRRKLIKIGIILLDVVSVYTNEIIKGFQSASDELYDNKVEYHLEMIPLDKVYDINCIRSKLEYYKDNAFDGIIILYYYNDAIIKMLNDFISHSMPIVLLSEDAKTCNRLFSVQNNTKIAGGLAAEMLFHLTRKRKVAIFAGDLKLRTHIGLIDGFKAVALKRNLEILHVYDTEESPELADIYLRQAFLEYPDMDGIYISSANSVSICKRLEQERTIYLNRVNKGYNNEKYSIKVVASDVFPELVEFMHKGIVDVTIFQNPYKQAKVAFENLYYYLAEDKAVSSTLLITPQIVLQSNIEIYSNNIMLGL